MSKKKKFKRGTVVVFDRENLCKDWWKQQTKADLLKWYGPLGYGKKTKKLFVFLAEVLDADGTPSGHCVLADMDDGKIVMMRHTSDFRKATEDEF